MRTVRLAPEIQRLLGGLLASAHSDIIAAELPSRFTELIDRLADTAPADAPVAPEFRGALLAALPSLRAFAISLTRRGDRADDLVQSAILKAWANKHRFAVGTNMVAWLCTILRNTMLTELRNRRRELQDSEGSHAARLACLPNQGGSIDLEALRVALCRLTPEQRESVLLIAQGMTYEEVAQLASVPIGTVKSRVSRARQRLAELMGIVGEDGLGPDPVMLSIVQEQAW